MILSQFVECSLPVRYGTTAAYNLTVNLGQVYTIRKFEYVGDYKDGRNLIIFNDIDEKTITYWVYTDKDMRDADYQRILNINQAR